PLRIAKKGVVARIEGVTDRNAAEALRGTELYIERDKLPEPDDDEIYHADIIGMAAQRSDGSDVGEVIAMQNFGAGDLLEIRLEGKKRTEFVPFDDQFVPEIDFDARRVTVVMPDDTAEAEGD
ncbi:MAG: ribosome maturation factor RimM, partial [Pseudomonadota bacterium]